MPVQERTAGSTSLTVRVYRFGNWCCVVINDTLVIDLRNSAAREGMQTHADFFKAFPFRGWEPMMTRTSNAAEKIAKRRMG